MIIDVSYAQGKIDWKAFSKDTSVDAVIIRAGFGRNNIDKQFASNIIGATKYKIPIGIYWFSYAYTTDMARDEARACLEAIKGYKVSLPIFFDWEYDSDLYARKQGVKPSKDLITRMNKAFCKTIEKAGYRAGYYLNLDYENNKIDCSQLKDYVKWYAQYASKAERSYDLWQYSSKVKVEGITANTVDANKPSDDFRAQFLNKKITAPKPTIKQGETGANVYRLQVCLNALGFTDVSKSRLATDGVYGIKTAQAVEAFKRKYKLPSKNGSIYGAVMYAKLKEVLSDV